MTDRKEGRRVGGQKGEGEGREKKRFSFSKPCVTILFENFLIFLKVLRKSRGKTSQDKNYLQSPARRDLQNEE